MVFVAQVRSGRSVDPNFRPERNSTLGHNGSLVTSSHLKRSQAMVSIPSRLSSFTTSTEQKRDTERTLDADPDSCIARLIRLAREGPIFPPAPRMTMSPSIRRIKPTSRTFGDASRCSSSCIVSMQFMSCSGYDKRFGDGSRSQRSSDIRLSYTNSQRCTLPIADIAFNVVSPALYSPVLSRIRRDLEKKQYPPRTWQHGLAGCGIGWQH